ncbi:CD82 molecule b isoform X1 [Narcine bancroftii]|uniref:CD82 molecule b isoform X1 n=1 Tax=Narcine bancroftii TaxID=1343680 RepID=UPI0038312801
MGKGCIKATKYCLFLFNLLFFILGAVILGFGLWILLDNNSFIAVLQSSSSALRVGSYILLGVGSVTMLLGFLGCLGAVNEVKCLLGLYFTCLLLILIAQITAGVLIYLQRDRLKAEIADVIHQMMVTYNPQENRDKSFGATWDYIQRKLHCCGWLGPSNWTENVVVKNSSEILFPCSCHQRSENDTLPETGFCEGVVPYTKENLHLHTSPGKWQMTPNTPHPFPSGRETRSEFLTLEQQEGNLQTCVLHYPVTRNHVQVSWGGTFPPPAPCTGVGTAPPWESLLAGCEWEGWFVPQK